MSIIVIYVLLVLCMITFDCVYYRFLPGRELLVYKSCVLASPLLLCLADALTGMLAADPSCLVVDLMVGAAVSISPPTSVSRYPAWLSMSYVSTVLCLSLSMSLLCMVGVPWVFALKTELLPFAVSVLAVGYQLLLFYFKCRKVVSLFSNEEVWMNLLWMSGSIYTGLLYISVAVLAMYDGAGSGPELYVAGGLAIVVIIVFYLRVSVGGTLLLPPAKEREVKVIVKGSLRTADMEGGFDDRKMGALYRKVMLFMHEKQPYLDGSVDLDYFSRKLFTNKAYLSRTINVFSGRNFRQFINWHRVEYSVGLMKKDPYLRVEEVALMSGFNSIVSYNMAFKMFKGVTPKEWMDKYREAMGI